MTRGRGQERPLSWMQKLATLVPILGMLGGAAVDVSPTRAAESMMGDRVMQETLRKDQRKLMQCVQDVLGVYGVQLLREMQESDFDSGSSFTMEEYVVTDYPLGATEDQDFDSMRFSTSMFLHMGENRQISKGADRLLEDRLTVLARDTFSEQVADKSVAVTTISSELGEFRVLRGYGEEALVRVIDDMLPNTSAIVMAPRENGDPATLFLTIDASGVATLALFTSQQDALATNNTQIGAEPHLGVTLAWQNKDAANTDNSSIGLQIGAMLKSIGSVSGDASYLDIGDFAVISSQGKQAIIG